MVEMSTVKGRSGGDLHQRGEDLLNHRGALVEIYLMSTMKHQSGVDFMSKR